jgi:hypothetical protein
LKSFKACIFSLPLPKLPPICSSTHKLVDCPVVDCQKTAERARGSSEGRGVISHGRAGAAGGQEAQTPGANRRHPGACIWVWGPNERDVAPTPTPTPTPSSADACMHFPLIAGVGHLLSAVIHGKCTEKARDHKPEGVFGGASVVRDGTPRSRSVVGCCPIRVHSNGAVAFALGGWRCDPFERVLREREPIV